MNNILEARGLTKAYGSFKLNNVSFDIPAGFITGFIGPNGAGKTTTIKLILDVVRADAGRIRLFGQECGGIKNDQIGVVLDTPLYVADWQVRDVERGISPFYADWDASRYAGYLRRFELDPKKKIKELSRGMKIKLQLAAALSHNARLLLLDEPTSGLDPVARDEIGDLLRTFVADEQRSVLFSTHITADLDKTADYIIFILNGQLAFTGTKETLLEKYARVTGGPRELDAGQKKLIIGYREYGAGFEGMTEAVNLGRLPSVVLAEKISLDEIIIFMNKGARSDE